jgi:hypothetical protein
MARSAPEIIADLFGCDIEEVRRVAYQPRHHFSPVYSWDDSPWSYLCCPPAGRQPPKSIPLKWEIVGSPWYDEAGARPVWGIQHKNTKN